MKTAVGLLFLISLRAAFAAAQIPQGTFKHIIIVVQENRTPDNLFGSSPPSGATCESGDPFESGVDIDNGAPNKKQGQLNPTCNVSTPLANMCNPAHNHIDFVNECDLTGGACLMDGACSNASSNCSGTCPQYAYVPQSDVQQYFQIAENYGFANYMFQTNEGPSFPAHQFLFAGTSAPAIYKDSGNNPDPCQGLGLPPCWTWFVADNPEPGIKAGDDTGCTAPSNQYLQTVDPGGTEQQSGYCTNNVGNPWCSIPCYERAAPNQQGQYTYGSLADLLGAQSPPISWKYYTPTLYTTGDTETIENGLWVAPISIRHFCLPGTYNEVEECTGLLNNGQYAANMRYETTPHPYPLVDDISDCSLAAVSWAIPDKLWSDHGGEDNGTGPFYVAGILDALGNATTCEGGAGYWSDTAIFIVWDDFGGWVDHVRPTPYPGVNRTGNTWGSGYTYGLRVPLLVVSAYTGILQNGTYSPYISGACGTSGQPTCPNNVAPYVHDFGSILAFIEWNFLGATGIGKIGQGYQFADNYAPELRANPPTVPLLDFFQLASPRPFVDIVIPPGYDVNYFQNYFTNNPSQTPDGPDADD